MLKYSANDIVEKALALADLQNSDFITFKEKIQYLNDSYVSMYNKMIDYGDNLFTETIKINGDEAELPSDFYQLREVFIMHNKIKTLITPKPLNQSHNELAYELVNNTLKVYGRHDGECFFTYYKVPQTLIVAPEKKDIELFGKNNEVEVDESHLNAVGKHLAFYKDWYIEFQEQDAYMRSLKDSTIKKTIHYAGLNINDVGLNSLAGIPSFKFFNKKYLFSLKGWTTATILGNIGECINSADNTTAGKITNDPRNVVILNNKPYFADASNIQSYVFNNGTLQEIRTEIHLEEELPQLTNFETTAIFFPYGFDYDNFIAFDTKKFKIGNGGETKAFADYLLPKETILQYWVDSDDKELGDSVVFMTSLNRMFGLNVEFGEPVLLKEIDKDLSFVGFDGFDPQTGYGLICYDVAREKFVMESAFDTTELTFPNNTYFTIIAYQLAILFCQKQNKDCTMLLTELQTQTDRFYDSLHRDETSFRITNVDSGYYY